MTNTTQTIYLTESGDLEVYEGKRPEEFVNSLNMTILNPELHHWLSTKRTVKMAQGELYKTTIYLLKPTGSNYVYPADVSDIVEIRDGLGYFKEPVVEVIEDIPVPIGKFIIDNAKGIQLADGAYYHYSEVIRLLKLYKRK